MTVITATHALSGAERGIVNKYGGVTPAILMADTLKMLGQGMKVGVEISLMAMDNGAVPYGEEILAVGAAVMAPTMSQPDPRSLQQPL